MKSGPSIHRSLASKSVRSKGFSLLHSIAGLFKICPEEAGEAEGEACARQNLYQTEGESAVAPGDAGGSLVPEGEDSLRAQYSGRRVPCFLFRSRNEGISVKRKPSNHSFSKFLQRIPRPAPDDAVIPQRVAHGEQQGIHKQHCADGMQQEVISRNPRAPRHARID